LASCLSGDERDREFGHRRSLAQNGGEVDALLALAPAGRHSHEVLNMLVRIVRGSLRAVDWSNPYAVSSWQTRF
jgi:hypothetical protein